MKRLAPLLALLALSTPARAEAPPPIPACAQPQVLLLVAEHLHRAGRRTEIEPGSIGEIPGALPNTIRCALRLHTPIYDTNRTETPQDEVSTFQYTLELRHNALFLTPGP